MQITKIAQLVATILANRDDNTHYLGYWLDDDMDSNEQEQAVEENLPKIIRDWADNACVSEYDDMPEYYALHFGADGWVSVEINNEDVSIVGSYDDAAEAMKHIASEWSDYSYAEVLSFYGYTVSNDTFDLADETDTNVQIWVRYHYQVGHLGGQSDGWLAEDWENGTRTIIGEQFGGIAVFNTYADAKEWVKAQESRTLLNHGEISLPDYLICR